MRTSKSLDMIRSDRSSRIHIIILYLLIACLMILWGIYFIYFSYLIRTQINELNRIKHRLNELELPQITITSQGNDDESSQRRLRHAKLKSKFLHKQEQEQLDAVFGSIHFKVPVRIQKKEIFDLK